jgi:flagellar basal body-associated protein FliL
METESKTPRLLIGIIVVLVLAILGSIYYWKTQGSNAANATAEDAVSTALTQPAAPAPAVSAVVETTPEEDLSIDVLTGVEADLSSGISN